jgi:hypothetical protein
MLIAWIRFEVQLGSKGVFVLLVYAATDLSSREASLANANGRIVVGGLPST